MLVVDDYHLITLPSVHAELAQLLAATPDLLRIVIATRHDPPLPLAKLRADGVLREVRVHDLRFEADEIAALVAASVGLELSPTEAAHLLRRTEGWAVGVQLAALTLADREDRAAFIEEFSGDDRHVADYLREVVLDRVPEELRIFLAETAILDRLSAPLCETVTGRPGAQAMLDELERRNLFLVPLDHRRRWYRYHHLFAEWLRLQPADDAAAGHRRAASWFTEQGFARRRRPAPPGRRGPRAGRRRHRGPPLGPGGPGPSGDAAGVDPTAATRRAPPEGPPGPRRRLGRLRRGPLVRGRADGDRPVGARASAEAGPDPEESLIRAEIELLDAGRLAAQGRLAEAGRGAAAGLALVDEEEPRARTGLLLVLGKARLDAGDLDGARLAFVEARRLAPSGRIPIVQLIARAHLAELDLLAGDAVAAEAGCRDALDFARASGLASHPEVAVAHLTLGRIQADAGRPEAARAELEQGEELAARIPYEPRARRAAELRRRLEAASAAGPGVEHPPVPGAHPAADDLRTGPTARFVGRADPSGTGTAPTAAVVADHPGDRRRALPVAQHGEDPLAQPVSQARGADPPCGHRGGPAPSSALRTRTRTSRRGTDGVNRTVSHPGVKTAHPDDRQSDRMDDADRATYRIEVHGRLPSGADALFPELIVEAGARTTTLAGPVADAAALYGLIARLESLGLALVAVRPGTDPPAAPA